MAWVIVVVALLVMPVAWWVGTGRGGQMAPEPPDRKPVPRLPEGDFTPQDVRDLRFAAVRKGYEMGQVDDLLDNVAHALAGTMAHPMTGQDVREARFRYRVNGGAYDMGQVDHALEGLATQLDRQNLEVSHRPESDPAN